MALSVKTNTSRYADICKKFENKYKMISEKFLEQFEAGKIGDEQEFFVWFAAARGLKLWRERDEILSGGSV
jgi:hypothetical protein